MRTKTKRIIGLSTIAVATSLTTALPAVAQEASDTAEETSDVIIVTATKRSESASKVPISISAYSLVCIPLSMLGCCHYNQVWHHVFEWPAPAAGIG